MAFFGTVFSGELEKWSYNYGKVFIVGSEKIAKGTNGFHVCGFFASLMALILLSPGLMPSIVSVSPIYENSLFLKKTFVLVDFKVILLEMFQNMI